MTTHRPTNQLKNPCRSRYSSNFQRLDILVAPIYNLILTILAAITYYLVYKGAQASMNSDEFINDPRHPRFAKGGKFIDLNKE